MPPTPPTPTAQSHKAEDIWKIDELVEEITRVADAHLTVADQHRVTLIE